MTIDELVREIEETASPLASGRHGLVAARSRSRVRGAAPFAVDGLDGHVDVTDREAALDVTGFVTAPSSSSVLAAFPGIRLQARTVLWAGGDGLALGVLSLAGRTKAVAVDIEVRGVVADPAGTATAVLAVRTHVDLADWGIAGGDTEISLLLAVRA